jgi:dephospho-CoA kinase
MLIGIVGLNGAGKGEFGSYLEERYGFANKDIGQMIRDELVKLGKDPQDRIEMQKLGTDRRVEFGLNYWVLKALKSANAKNTVITSVRNPAEANEILSRGGVIVEIHAEQMLRFGRTVERLSGNPTAHGEIDLEQFKLKERLEFENKDLSKQQMRRCIEMAKYRVENNGSREELHKKIDELLKSLNFTGR